MALKVELGGGAKKMRIRTPHCQRIHVTMQMLSPSEVRVEREGPLQVFQSRCHSWPLTPCPSYWLVLWRNGTLFDIWETVCSLALSLQTSPDNLKWVVCIEEDPAKQRLKRKERQFFLPRISFLEILCQVFWRGPLDSILSITGCWFQLFFCKSSHDMSVGKTYNSTSTC